VLRKKRHYVSNAAQIEKIDRVMRALQLNLHTGLRQWVCASGNDGTTRIFWPLPALSAQKEPTD